MTTGAHPLQRLGDHPSALQLGLSLVEDREKGYVRLAMLWPMMLFKQASDPDHELDRLKYKHLTLMDISQDALDNGPDAALGEITQKANLHRSMVMERFRTSNFKHPLGDDHPFLAVHALAQTHGPRQLEIVIHHEGALMRLYHSKHNLVFKLQGDPGSAMDRQRFDYWDHARLQNKPPVQMLAEIKHHIAKKALT